MLKSDDPRVREPRKRARRERASLNRQLEDALLRRQSMLRIARQFAGEGDAHRLLRAILSEATALVGAEAGVVGRWVEARQVLVLVASTVPNLGLPSERRPGQGASGRAVLERRPVILNNFQEETDSDDPSRQVGFQAAVGVPLLHEGRLIGSLSLATTDPHKQFTVADSEDLQLLAGIAASAVMGLERAQLAGITMAAREVAHRLANDLAMPAWAVETLLDRPDLPADLRETLEAAAAGLSSAAVRLSQLQNVVRVETYDTPFGPALDLERSATTSR